MTNFTRDTYRWFCRDAEQKKRERQARLDYMMVRQACMHKLISGGAPCNVETRALMAECVSTYHPVLSMDGDNQDDPDMPSARTITRDAVLPDPDKPYTPPDHYDVVI